MFGTAFAPLVPPFAGIFKEHSVAAEVHAAVGPPEAHRRIGAVERRSAVLRTLIERLGDNHGVTGGEGIDFVLVASTKLIKTRPHRPTAAVHIKLRLASSPAFLEIWLVMNMLSQLVRDT